MQMIQKDLFMKERELKKLIDTLKNRVEKYPEGNLTIARNKQGNSYYHCVRDEKCAKNERMIYISKREITLIRALAQKSYDKKVLKWASKCHRKIEELLECYNDGGLDKFYDDLSEPRKELVIPVEGSVNSILKSWDTEYKGKAFQQDMPYIVTEKGERVRSKSEKILADNFLRKGVPYHYEKPLVLQGYGILQGKNLLLSFETTKGGLHTDMINALLEEFLL